jgi:AraC family transcriptional regulator
MLEQRLLRAALYVERHLGEPLTLERLAGEACISTYHFHRLFRLWLGEPVMEYVRRLRIEHAAYRLRASTRPVQAIARDVGYASADAFGRAFRERFGESPREYRARWAETSLPVEDAATSSAAQRTMSADILPTDTPARVRVIRLDAWYLIGLRHLGPYQGVWRAWASLAEWAAREAPALSSAPRIGISHDDPGMVPDASKIRYDACYAVGAAEADAMRALARAPLHWREMPAADYAATIHRGSYDALGDAYRRLFIDWLPRSGRYPGDAPVVEWYRNSPRDAPTEALRTALLLPLE